MEGQEKRKELKALIDLHEGIDLCIKWRMTDMCNYDCSYCLRHELTQGSYRAEDKKRLEEKEQVLCDEAKAINDLLMRSPHKKAVKINLIGGEVSIFDLKKILGYITAPNYKRSQMTTNFSRSVEYYIDLYNFLKERGKLLTITCSFHPQYTTIERFFDKAVRLNAAIDSHVRIEMVSQDTNQDLCAQFKEMAEENNLKYMIDVDLSRKTTKNKDEVMHGGNVAKKTRYLAMYDDGTEEEYITRNDFLVKNPTPQNAGKMGVKTEGYYCTHSYDYLYIEFGWVIGRNGATITSCNGKFPIDKFTIIDQPYKCLRPACTLCGNCSIAKDKDVLMDYESIIGRLNRD